VVFLELGYALALNKAAVIICDKEKRQQLPFDVRHRPIIFYDTHSPSSFNKLVDLISLNLKAEIDRDKKIQRANVKSSSNGVSMDEYENIVIGILLSYHHSDQDGLSAHIINRDFEKFSYSNSTLSVALGLLTSKGYVEKVELWEDQTEEKYIAYKLTDDGMRYILENRSIFAAKRLINKMKDDIF